MGHVHDPVFRSAGAQRGARPAARGGGPAARGLTRVLVLAVAMWLAQPLVAHADTVSPRDYRQRLTDARALVVQARAVTGAARDAAVTRARTLLLTTTAIVLPAGDLVINDSALAERIVSSDAALDAAVTLLDVQLALASRAVSPSLDAARSDAALRDVLRAVETAQASPSFF